MVAEDKMILIKGKDATDSVASYEFVGDKCNVIYKSGPGKVYSYDYRNVRELTVQRCIDPSEVVVLVDGVQLTKIDLILDFGPYYRIIREGKRDVSYHRTQVSLQDNCLAQGAGNELFEYFRETAEAVSLVTDNGINILSRQYVKVEGVSSETVLASYFDPDRAVLSRPSNPNAGLIYPFGLNQSQKVAVENAFSSQVSIIQGPPGTGKTQTILNIIANAVRQGKTVAVVSNNNSATKNVAEKLEKKGAAFLTAFLGNLENKARFLDEQTGRYPDMREWVLQRIDRDGLGDRVKKLVVELDDMLEAKNRIAGIEQELLELKPEQHYFGEYYATCDDPPGCDISGHSSRRILNLWLEYEQHIECENRIGFLKKLSIWFRFGCRALKLFDLPPEQVIPFLQSRFYTAKESELLKEKAALEKRLENYSFDEKMNELEEKSLQLFRAELAERYQWRDPRKMFQGRDFRSKSGGFTREYPVVLSTTYSVKGTLDVGHIYDYLIIDEASQVDLATGVLAFSCARNVVIVGDQMQLPNVLTDRDRKTADEIWGQHEFDKRYRFSTHSLLSSATEIWKTAPSVLLREHYRCHPKIINFCNQKFYGGKLIVMTEDRDEPGVLMMYRTVAGNHARGHMNQRQIDVIKEEILPRLERAGLYDTGIITPYRDQVSALRKQLGDQYEIATVHKFQGREKQAILLTSVDNVITDFVDDPNMLNVAVSRAIKTLAVIISQDPRNDKTGYGDLARYIEYNNCEVIESAVYSVFDLLYKGYAKQRREYLLKHKRISEYDSENLMYSIITGILEEEQFGALDCAAHISLATLIRDFEKLDMDERQYACNPMTHTDFLVFRKFDKSPVLAIEVDGTSFHQPGSKQATRDAKKNSIFEKCNIPLLRLRTDESQEAARIRGALEKIVNVEIC